MAVLHGLGAFGTAQIQRLKVLKRHAHGGVQSLRNGQVAGTGAADDELFATEIGFRLDILGYELLENGAVQGGDDDQIIVRTGFGKGIGPVHGLDEYTLADDAEVRGAVFHEDDILDAAGGCGGGELSEALRVVKELNKEVAHCVEGAAGGAAADGIEGTGIDSAGLFRLLGIIRRLFARGGVLSGTAAAGCQREGHSHGQKQG